jgi:hypothetical protein
VTENPVEHTSAASNKPIVVASTDHWHAQPASSKRADGGANPLLPKPGAESRSVVPTIRGCAKSTTPPPSAKVAWPASPLVPGNISTHIPVAHACASGQSSSAAQVTGPHESWVSSHAELGQGGTPLEQTPRAHDSCPLQ